MTSPEPCPACGAEGTLRKTLTAAAVHFKGSGWAKKDRSTSRPKVKSTEGSDGAAASPEAAAKGTGDASSPSSADGDPAPAKKAPPAADSNKHGAGSAQAEG